MSARAPAAHRLEPTSNGPRTARSGLIPLLALVLTIGGSIAIGTLAAGSPVIAATMTSSSNAIPSEMCCSRIRLWP